MWLSALSRKATRTASACRRARPLCAPDYLTRSTTASTQSRALSATDFDDTSMDKAFASMKLLVANRGEIACRVLETARRLGVPTVAVYSDADRGAEHVRRADEAVCVGAAPAMDSYLRGDRVLAAARRLRVTAIHPGYGFLSENSEFAEHCEAAGIAFVGPPAAAIRAMGDKKEAKDLMTAAGVAVVPGYQGTDQSLHRLQAEAAKIGFPLLVKAVMGGGGKGMKLARSPEEVENAVVSAMREAAASFKDDRVLLERFIEKPRHIEVQVFADKHGNVVHLHERDCSVQRRHQKVIEEAPGPGITEEFRKEIGAAAVAAAQAVGYVGAGTVEFILDTESGNYYFMEMNTRLQVEHPVTEMITGLDLVEQQLRVAAGHMLPFAQADLHIHGHAIEARIYAENTSKDFLPASGTVRRWRVPPGAGAFSLSSSIRVDSGIIEGDTVGTLYDPMIAKVVAHGPDRAAAVAALTLALGQLQVAGLPTNIPFVKALLQHPAFLAGSVDTNFITTHRADLDTASERLPWEVVAVASVARFLAASTPAQSTQSDVWASASAKRLNGLSTAHTMRFVHPNSKTKQTVSVARDSSDILKLTGHGGEDAASAWRCDIRDARLAADGDLRLEMNRQMAQASVSVSKAHETGAALLVDVWYGGSQYQLEMPEATAAESEGDGNAGGLVRTPMPGKVLKVLVAAGQRVAAGEPVAVVEAMKMEHTLRAGRSGVVSKLSCTEGGQVQDGHVMAVIEVE